MKKCKDCEWFDDGRELCFMVNGLSVDTTVHADNNCMVHDLIDGLLENIKKGSENRHRMIVLEDALRSMSIDLSNEMVNSISKYRGDIKGIDPVQLYKDAIKDSKGKWAPYAEMRQGKK